MPSSPAALCAALAFSLAAAPLRAQDEPQSWRLALGYLQRGLHAEAAAQLRAFLAESPRDRRATEARYRLGVCELELGQVERALPELEKAAADRRFALRAECLYRLAGALQHAGRRADARRRFEELLAAVGEDHYLAAAAHFGAGECARDDADERAAAAHFLAAADRAGADDPAGYRFAGLYQAGYALLRADAPADAATAFALLAERFPQHDARGEVLHLLGEAYHRAGDARLAEAAWQQAVAAGGEFADDAQSGLAWSRRGRGDGDGALAAFDELARRFAKSPLAPAARLEAARIRFERGEAEAVARQCERLAADGAAGAEVRRGAQELAGLARLELGDAEAARAALERAADGAPPADAARLRYAIAECDAAAGRFDAALDGYRACARATDAALRGDALYGQVVALHALGRHAESAERAEELARTDAGHRLAPYAAFALAENLFALEQFDAARARFDALGAEHPLAADARFKAAWSAWLAGDAADARTRFAAVAGDSAQSGERRDEALSMAALAAYTAGDAVGALELADTYRARHPRGANLARTERVAARVLRERGDTRAAGERLAAAARADGGAEVALERADLLFADGDFAAARDAFAEHARRDDALGARALEGLAWCAFELGDDAACRRWIDAGVAHPAAGDVAAGLRELRVTLAHRAEDWAAARAAAEEFLAAHADHARAPEVRYALGTALARGGDPQAARAVLEPLADAPGIARPALVLYELGWACRKSGDAGAARAAFARAAQRAAEPELADECRVRAAELDLDAERRDAARALLAEVRHPTWRGRARYLTAQAWLADGRLTDAVAAFDEVVALGRSDALFADALFASGETAHRAEQWDVAADRLGRFLEQDSGAAAAPRARLLLGECLARQGDPAAAIGHLRAYLEQADGEPEVARARGQLWLGRAFQARGQHAEAEAAYAAAAALSAGEIGAEAWFRTGETRRDAGDLVGAADAFVRVTILFAHDAWVRRALLEGGRSFDALGRDEQAMRLWRELVQRFADSDEARAVAGRVNGGGR